MIKYGFAKIVLAITLTICSVPSVEKISNTESQVNNQETIRYQLEFLKNVDVEIVENTVNRSQYWSYADGNTYTH